MEERPLPQLTLKQHRERTVAQLCDHFARDHLELAEFESRLDVANRAATAQELDGLLQDLPAAAPAAPPAVSQTRDAMARGGRAVQEAVRDTRTLIAFMGGVERRGHWTPARKTVGLAFMGGVGLDFREVDLPPGVTEVFLVCCMGGAEIIVPPGLCVDANGIAIMGAFEQVSARRAELGAPILRINGLCIMGGVEISVREPGESAKDARLRQRDERRALRDQNRQRREGQE